ncbi:MAG: hypothetical protein QXU18_13490 [Thermoplasmatales archaeon]
MTEIIFEPYNKIIIRSFMKFDTPRSFGESLVLEQGKGLQIGALRLFWANGILFRHFPLPLTESTMQQLINGIFIVDHIDFTEMKEYQGEIMISQGVKIKVLNVTKHSVFSELTKFITEKLLEKKN